MASAKHFKAIQRHCLAKAGAVEDYPWGDVVWKVNGKIFASGCDSTNEFTVKATPDEQRRLIRDRAIKVAAYVGRFGWVTVTVSDARTLKLAKTLIGRSYGAVAKRKSKPGR